MTVRQKLDALTSEPPVGDLGYMPDQRQVAGLMLGLQLLADEIDNLRRLSATVVAPTEVPAGEAHSGSIEVAAYAAEGVAEVATQLVELTDQVKKLTKAVRKASRRG